MTIPKIIGGQRDFSAGELDVSLKRADDNPILKMGARQMSNFRILNSKGVQNRPGRRVLFPAIGRVEEVLMPGGTKFYLIFSNGTFTIRNSSGTIVHTEAGQAWVTATLNQITWALFQKTIYIGFPGIQPLLTLWDGASTWTNLVNLNNVLIVTSGGQRRTLFYRIAPKNVTMQPSGSSAGVGVIMTFSSPIWTPSVVGTLLRYIGRQIAVTGYTSAQSLTGICQENLPTSAFINFATTTSAYYSVGDLVIGSASGAKALVVTVGGGTGTILQVQMLTVGATNAYNVATPNPTAFGAQNVTGFLPGEVIVGPGGALPCTTITGGLQPQGVSVWDEQAMSDYRGWPSSVAVDQGRLILSNFPSVPSAIGWSSVGNPFDFYVGASQTDAMMEIAPNNSKVLYVQPGPESNEIVFCDNAVYYIPISPSNPLKPGSVAFNFITFDGVAPVTPRVVDEVMIYVNVANSVMALTMTGSYSRFYRAIEISQNNSHLFTGPVAIAIPASATFQERYIYVLNADGSIAVGKYSSDLKDLKASVGWTPWSGNGTVTWVGALNADMIFTTTYAPNGIPAVGVAELLDDTRYLDGSQLYNTQPSGLPIPGGKGPLWWLAGGSVDLMDGPLGTRMMGTYTVDANGFLVPKNSAGEDFTSVNLVAGQAWTATLELFAPMAPPGQNVHQRMAKRRVSRMAVYVVNSTGFLLARLFSGPVTRTSPALGTTMNTRRIATWNQDDDPTQPPPLREEVQRWRPLGRAFDPRVAIIKDTPGPLQILEIAIEASV